MRRLLGVVLGIAILISGCNDSKPKNTYNPDRVENEKHPQPVPDSVPQAGVNALKEIKQIRKAEDADVKDQKKVLEQSDSQ